MVTALCRSDTTLSSELLHFADTVDKLDTPEKVLDALHEAVQGLIPISLCLARSCFQ